MTKYEYICDRCGQNIIEDRTLIKVETGIVRQSGHTDIDLCKDCGERLLDFMRTNERTLINQ